MAKIRVYELARDLNMKSRTLLDKLNKMDISVGSHVSSLDDDVVARIRAKIKIADEKPPKAETARRSKQTVIRRPRTSGSQSETSTGPASTATASAQDGTVEAEADTAGSLSERHGLPAEAETGRDNNKDRPSRKAGRKKGGDQNRAKAESGKTDPESTSAKEEIPESEKSAKPKKTRRKKRRRKKDMPAKIIKLPVPEEQVPEAAVAVGTSKVSELVEDSAPVGKTGTGDGTSASRPTSAGEVADKPDAERKNLSEKETKAKDKDKDKKRKPWRKKTETGDVSRNPVSPDNKKAKDTKWAKKKISFRRKEVVEGAALYTGGQRGRKNRRGGKTKNVKPQQATQITTPKAIKRRVRIDETIVLSDLAKRMGIKASEMIKTLMMLGVMVTVNQTIDFDTAVLVASEFDYEVERAAFEEETILLSDREADDPDKLLERPPVVTIMGHVDHGKTSLLDIIRKTRVTETEAGGITQHIGAYSVSTENGQITFLDTPGHEAFTSMRARGAKVTDLVVLVVAADDGVMPQTIEAINHSRAADVPIIVAVNKTDKANADTDRVYRELSDHGLVPEEWGGDTILVKVSAKQNIGIDNLLEMILLQSEVLELKANPDRLAVGYVVESKLDSGRGPVATVLVQEGTLLTGGPVVCGVHHGKIRAMISDVGLPVEEAGPSIPVEVLGLSGVPNAGDELIVLDDEKSAKQVSTHRIQKQRARELAKTSRMSLEKLFEKMQEGEVKDLNLIIRADVHGSIEALGDSLIKLSNEEVTINVVHSATGTITETDISLAAVSDAIIIGFNVRPTPKVQSLANEEHVDMRFYNVIYNVIKDIQDAILGMMESTYEERVLGRAEVREVFHVPKVGAIAGCYVTHGKIPRGSLARLLRDGVVLFERKLSSLRRFKDDVREVQSGYECGIGLENYNDIKVGDVIECYYLEEIRPEL